MQKNETMLTPLFRYVIYCLEKNDLSNLSELLNKIEEFHGHLKSNTEKDDNYNHPIEKTITFIKIYMKDKDEAKKYWEVTKRELESFECKRCYLCENCQSYYWKEIGSLFFDDVINEEKRNKKYFPMRVLPKKIRRHLESSVGLSEIYINQARRNKKEFDDKLIILKGMSSSTPSMLNSIFDTEEFDGGGIYFRWHGCGVAIDPGYHFVRNLHHYGLSVLDIDVVIITHEHIDHNSDMRLLEDIHFTIARYEADKLRNHKIKWYMDKISYKMARTLQDNESGFSKETNELFQINPDDMTYCAGNKSDSLKNGIDIDTNIKLSIFKTQHIYSSKAGGYKTHTFGCRFSLSGNDLERSIAYTSDTRYFPELVKQIQGVDILIANISGIYEDDYMLVKEKENHLGYYGCFGLVYECYKKYCTYPQLYFLSEFWNGKSDIRFDVVSQLNLELKEKGIEDMGVFPAESGLTVSLWDLSMKCSKCGKYSKDTLVKKPNGLHDKVDILCKECYY